MEKNTAYEGENLRRILIAKFGDLKTAAKELDFNYSYLSSQQGEKTLSLKFKRKIAKLIGVPVSAIETGELPDDDEPDPRFENDAEELEYWRGRAIAATEKIERLYEELRKAQEAEIARLKKEAEKRRE